MSLFRRGAAAELSVQPAAVLPTNEIQAVVRLHEDLTDVSSATLQLGYVNSFHYHWAGRRDAAARSSDSLLTLGQVGTNYGSGRTTTEWVPVITEELPTPSGQLAAGEHRAGFRVPSWAPGSAKDLITWAVRLKVHRKGRDIEQDAQFTVLAPAPAVLPAALEQQRVMGNSSDIDITLAQQCLRPGDPIRGSVSITPHSDVPEADVGALFQRQRLSHPVDRTPSDGEVLDGPTTSIDKHVALQAGVTTTLQFEVPLPADAAPSAEAVNSSYVWYLQVRILYKGFSSHTPERVRRQFVVYNAP